MGLDGGVLHPRYRLCNPQGVVQMMFSTKLEIAAWTLRTIGFVFGGSGVSLGADKARAAHCLGTAFSRRRTTRNVVEEV
jgi:hypothetical protein